jgi:hypothetical protein
MMIALNITENETHGDPQKAKQQLFTLMEMLRK